MKLYNETQLLDMYESANIYQDSMLESIKKEIEDWTSVLAEREKTGSDITTVVQVLAMLRVELDHWKKEVQDSDDKIEKSVRKLEEFRTAPLYKKIWMKILDI